jgi:uncharacterized radical SAM superfamily Fe-S cluster-containing enzyme
MMTDELIEAVTRPTMRFVELKRSDQVDLQALQRIRDQMVGNRTRMICQMRAFCLEYGVAIRQCAGLFKRSGESRGVKSLPPILSRDYGTNPSRSPSEREREAWQTATAAPDITERALDRARQVMIETGQWDAAQSMGRRWPIGFVALEITQRCNLDCGACYLSEHSEAVKDLPLAEIYRRIDMIRETYGPDVDVQVTGGDPTLRNRGELLAIVRRLRQIGMRPALFTNGIRATRDLLKSLVDAGLVDLAFHVDLTQGRRGYRTERDLNEVRQAYLERARGLPLSVFFNTTVFDGNFEQIPDVAAFFVRNSDVVRLASFQPQAQTGRGALRPRSQAINTASIIRQIEKGTGTPISFDTAHAGHSECNRYASRVGSRRGPGFE